MQKSLKDCPFIDVDRHVTEPIDLWRNYLDPAFVDYIPYYGKPKFVVASQPPPGELVQLPPLLEMKGQPVIHQWSEAAQIEIARNSSDWSDQVAKGSVPEQHLEVMDQTGVDQGCIYPTFALLMVYNETLPPDAAAALANAYNRWLFDYCAINPERLRGSGLIPRHNPDHMLAELEHIRKLGWHSVVMSPGLFLGRSLGHPDYEPFWQACEDNNISIVLHGVTHLRAPTAGADRYQSHFALHACSHVLEAQMGFLSVLESGVLERHPKLRFAFVEAGASWLLHWLWRLDEINYVTLPGEVADNVKRKPSEYFRRQCWVTFEATEPCLDQLIDMIGADRLLFGTDFPHPDHFQFDPALIMGSDSPFSDQHRRMVLYDNPKAFFGF